MSAKKGKSASEGSTYQPKDIVLAKIRGFPPWPGIIVDSDTVPEAVAKERPSGKNTFYAVRFFPVGDFAWSLPKDLSKLQKHEIESYVNEPWRKSGDLLKAYKTALDPDTWQTEIEKRPQAAAAVDDEVDELNSEDEEGASTKKSKATKKRRRDSEPASAKKAAGTTKRAKKEAPEPKKKGAKAKAKSKSMVESEDDAGDEEKAPASKKTKKVDKSEDDDEALANDPEAAKVKEWRHKLQKAFLGKTPPNADAMPDHDKLFSEVEAHDMSLKALTYSKIGKVMRHITAQPAEKIPREAEFNIKARAQALVDKWGKAAHNKPNGKPASAAADGEETTANGAEAMAVDSKDADADAEAAAETEKPEEPNGVAQEAGDVSVPADVTMSEA